MSDDVDLRYDPSTLLEPLDIARVSEFRDYLRGVGQEAEFDPSYLRHLSRHHGGRPQKRYFTTSHGAQYAIERFLNFIDYRKNDVLGWYNVSVTWTQIEDRLNEYLIPFAALSGGDFLCFDYEHGGRPRIVVWLHEESEEDAPATDYVATNFDEFLNMLGVSR